MLARLNLKSTFIHDVYENVQSIPYGIDMMKVRDVWEMSKKGSGVIVAIIDSGCDINHPDLEGQIIGVKNFTKEDNGDINNVMDYIGHGTHVAGIIAAVDNKQGVVGGAPESKLLILKTIDKKSSASYESVIEAIEYAIHWRGEKKEKVSIINMSLGGKEHSERLFQTIKMARKFGITVVVAAGNAGDGQGETDEYSYPGFYKDVIQVSSVDENGGILSFSASNLNLDFVAPGEGVFSTHLNGRYVKLSGTSMATPYVVGAIALVINIIKEKEAEVNTCKVYNYLLTHTKKLGYEISQEGNGLVQLK